MKITTCNQYVEFYQKFKVCSFFDVKNMYSNFFLFFLNFEIFLKIYTTVVFLVISSIFMYLLVCEHISFAFPLLFSSFFSFIPPCMCSCNHSSIDIVFFVHLVFQIISRILAFQPTIQVDNKRASHPFKNQNTCLTFYQVVHPRNDDLLNIIPIFDIVN